MVDPDISIEVTPEMIAEHEARQPPPETRDDHGVPFQFQVPDMERTVYLIAVGILGAEGDEGRLEYTAGDPCLGGFHPIVYENREAAETDIGILKASGFGALLVERTEKIIEAEE